jgi:hypothetical protein
MSLNLANSSAEQEAASRVYHRYPNVIIQLFCTNCYQDTDRLIMVISVLFLSGGFVCSVYMQSSPFAIRVLVAAVVFFRTDATSKHCNTVTEISGRID